MMQTKPRNITWTPIFSKAIHIVHLNIKITVIEDGGHFNPWYYTVNSIVSAGVEMSNFDTKSGHFNPQHFNPRQFNPRKFNPPIKADLPRQ